MDKNGIKKFAIWARKELIARVAQKAAYYGITREAVGDPAADTVNGHLLSPVEKTQRQALIRKIEEESYEQVLEEVAYTWFNRFIALRFMELNGYLPSHIRVFTDENNTFHPEILNEALDLDMEGFSMDRVYDFKEKNDEEGLFSYLLIAQCNDLNTILPGMFQKISDYTELLLPDHLLREGSVIDRMITMIPEEDWKDQVQIMGWLYQYYNTEPKAEVFAALKKNKKVTKDKIPAATQLFTPDWIVRYMVENSLGRLWLEGHPQHKDHFLPTKEERSAYIESRRDDGKWHYYLEEAKQEPEVQKKLEVIYKEHSALKPEDIRCMDPCMGSGHILCYLFDVLIQIYEDYGVSRRQAVKSIVKNNLWGLDIDDRASQLAYFAVMMKARQYDNRFFRSHLQPHVYSIHESNRVDRNLIETFAHGDLKLKADMESIYEDLHDAKDYGSLVHVRLVNFKALYSRFNEMKEGNIPSIFEQQAGIHLLPLVYTAQALSQKYHIVVTNPPYMGSSHMNSKLSEFIKRNFPNSKNDLFAAFLEHGTAMAQRGCFNCMVTMQSWMFLSSFEKLRTTILQNMTITDLMHMGNMVMGIAFGTAVTVIRNQIIVNYKGTYFKIESNDLINKEPFTSLLHRNKFFQIEANKFTKIPGSPIAYWCSKDLQKDFTNATPLGKIASAKQGLATGDNNRFVREWYEVCFQNTSFNSTSTESSALSHKKWFPYNKGGQYRKWYGNNEFLVNWEDNGLSIKNNRDQLGHIRSAVRNSNLYFRPCISWSLVSSADTAFRYKPAGHIFDVAGMSCFTNDRNTLLYLLGLCNTNVTKAILKIIAPTINYQCGDIAKIPVLVDDNQKDKVISFVNKNINISREDWDSFETSWDFQLHPLLAMARHSQDWCCSTELISLEECYRHVKDQVNGRFDDLKKNEEELNRIFIDIYGLQKELTPEEEDRDVTVARIYDTKEEIPEPMKGSRYALTKEDVVKSLISYGVGCLFGRYSLATPGLAYAGGPWDSSKYAGLLPDEDNIIPICDDEYFSDDMVGLFVQFMEAAFGKRHLEENLQFLAQALGGKGTSREVLRHYFLSDFYKDHVKTYQKRPIYWLFDSGKKNGFKCLIYMHRYQPDTLAKIRTDYIHEQQSRYRTAIDNIDHEMNDLTGANRVKLEKKLQKLKAQEAETEKYEEKVHHLADRMISIDLDDGVKHNYAIFQDVLAKI